MKEKVRISFVDDVYENSVEEIFPRKFHGSLLFTAFSQSILAHKIALPATFRS